MGLAVLTWTSLGTGLAITGKAAGEDEDREPEASGVELAELEKVEGPSVVPSEQEAIKTPRNTAATVKIVGRPITTMVPQKECSVKTALDGRPIRFDPQKLTRPIPLHTMQFD